MIEHVKLAWNKKITAIRFSALFDTYRIVLTCRGGTGPSVRYVGNQDTMSDSIHSRL